MKKLIALITPVLLFGLVMIGCEGEAPTVPVDDLKALTAEITIPSGATLVSATMGVFAFDVSGQTVNVRRVTAAWDEGTVTWNSFGGAYDPTIIGSFLADAPGWYTVDMTTTVQGYLDGDFENFGVHLEQGETIYTRYFSSEYTDETLRPWLEICYDMGGAVTCITIQEGAFGMVEDAYISELQPDLNAGGYPTFFTGVLNGILKQALVKFDMEVVIEPASLGDTVWYDDNQNGLQDEGELGVAEVVVHLYSCVGELLASTVTDENGFYIFDNLMPGDYFVGFEAPDGFYFTLQDQGADNTIDSDVDPTTGMTVCTTLESGEHDMTWDAGLYSIPMEGCTRTIGYWKTHSGFGPQDDVVTPLLPIWLGTPGGDHSIAVTDNVIAHDILTQHVYGRPSNGITKLYAQLLAAKLNIASDASFGDIEDALGAADEFLADHYYTDWDTL